MMQKDSLKEVCVCLTVVVVLLAVLAIFPDWKIGEWKVKRVNIFSDLSVRDTLADVESVFDTMTLATGDTLIPMPGQSVLQDTVVRIEDFSADTAMHRFYRLLTDGTARKRPVRVAFLGDSYTEADLITEDLREWLQQSYGGEGVGFVPVSSPAGGYRLTVKQEAEGWTSYSMVFHQKADWRKLLASGQYFEPAEGATFTLKVPDGEKARPFSGARFFFMNKGNTQIQATVDGRDTLFVPVSNDSLLQQLYLQGNIQQLDVRLTQTEGFTAFGTYLGGRRGVYVDNFALRGSSGIVLSIMDRQLMAQLRENVTYDLVVLEFGLNVVMPDVKAYTAYRRQMLKAIARLQDCFPGAAQLLVSVPDRGYRNEDGSFGTRSGVPALVAEQQRIAREAGIAFWDMYRAMGGRDAMVRFVKHDPPLGNKDYTHINHHGGRKIAGELIKALQAGISDVGSLE